VTVRRLLVSGLSLLLVSLLTVAWLWAGWALAPAGQAIDVEVAVGQRAGTIGQTLREAGGRLPAWAFRVALRLGGADRTIRPGIYRIEPGQTLRDFLGRLARGEILLVSVRLGEGWTLRQSRAALAATEGLRVRADSLDEPALMAALGAAGLPAEGQFFPDTYVVPRGSDDLAVLALAHRAMRARLERAWQDRDPAVPVSTPQALLVLASLIEKETGLEAERGLVAGVFVNRLRAGMRLQTDPSVIYGLGERYDGRLHKRDLLADTPFNTYQRAGLPPTPICLPGEASLRAAAHPAATDALYFVARGDGSSAFSATLEAHNRAVSRYILHR
jgi:UPF0755 protein